MADKVALICANGFGTMAEIAAMSGILASDGAGYITGQKIRVDGGLMRGL